MPVLPCLRRVPPVPEEDPAVEDVPSLPPVRSVQVQDLPQVRQEVRLIHAYPCLEANLNKREFEVHAKEEEQKKREAAHNVFLTPRIQITPEDQPEMTIKPWKSPVTGGTESTPGASA